LLLFASVGPEESRLPQYERSERWQSIE